MNPFEDHDPHSDPSLKSFEGYLRRFQPRPAEVKLEAFHTSELADLLEPQSMSQAMDEVFMESPSSSLSTSPTAAVTPTLRQRSWTELGAAWSGGMVIGAALMFLLVGQFQDRQPEIVLSELANSPVPKTVPKTDVGVYPTSPVQDSVPPTVSQVASSNEPDRSMHSFVSFDPLAFTGFETPESPSTLGAFYLRSWYRHQTASNPVPNSASIDKDHHSSHSLPQSIPSIPAYIMEIDVPPVQSTTRATQLLELLKDAI